MISFKLLNVELWNVREIMHGFVLETALATYILTAWYPTFGAGQLGCSHMVELRCIFSKGLGVASKDKLSTKGHQNVTKDGIMLDACRSACAWNALFGAYSLGHGPLVQVAVLVLFRCALQASFSIPCSLNWRNIYVHHWSTLTKSSPAPPSRLSLVNKEEIMRPQGDASFYQPRLFTMLWLR